MADSFPSNGDLPFYSGRWSTKRTLMAGLQSYSFGLRAREVSLAGPGNPANYQNEARYKGVAERGGFWGARDPPPYHNPFILVKHGMEVDTTI